MDLKKLKSILAEVQAGPVQFDQIIGDGFSSRERNSLAEYESLGLVFLTDLAGEKLPWIKDEAYESPERYRLNFGSYSEVENDALANLESHWVDSNMGKSYSSGSVQVFGAQMPDIEVADRALLLSNAFIQSLVSGDDPERYFSGSEGLKSLEWVKTQTGLLEDFSYTMPARVSVIYNGDLASGESLWWSSGTLDDQKRAITLVGISNWVSPSGIPLNLQMLMMSIVEMDSGFRIDKVLMDEE